jgi:hypothetical protein
MYKGLGNGFSCTTQALKRDVIFGTCNVRNLYRAGTLKTVARELQKYKLDLLVSGRTGGQMGEGGH